MTTQERDAATNDSTGTKMEKKPIAKRELLVGASLASAFLVVIAVVVGFFDPKLSDPAGATMCGEPPPVADEDVKGKIRADAKSLGKLLDSPELSKEVSRKRTEIFSKYGSGERTVAYYQYQVCVLLMSDKSMSTPQKLSTLESIRKEELKPRNGIARMYEYKVLNKKLDGGNVTVKSTFQRLDDFWIEIQNDVALFEFDQVLNDGNYVYLKDKERKICIKIPLNGNGASGYISVDDCASWQAWNNFFVKQF